MFRHVAIFIYGTSGGLTCDVGPEPRPPARRGREANGDAGLGAGERKQREEEKGQRKKNYEKKKKIGKWDRKKTERKEMQKNRVR